MNPGEKFYSIASRYILAWLLTLGSADYVHRHEHSIQMKNYEHPWFGNNSIRFCAFNQYLDKHEGRCMIIPGGGTAISIDDDTTCDVEALRPHPSIPSNYYACRKTKTILAKCKNGQRFENRLKRCAIDVYSSDDDFSDNEDSPDAYDHIHLPACDRTGRFPVPQGNCTIFYACKSNGFRLFRTMYKCPPSTGFDPFTKMCSSEFACDNDSESDAQLTKINPEPESTTLEPRDYAITTTTQTFTTFAPSTMDLQVTSSLNNSTPSSVLEKSTISNFRSLDNFGSDGTTEIIKTTTTSQFNETETTSAASPFNLISESEFQTTTDNIVSANQVLTILTTQNLENQEITSTSEATSTRKEVLTSEDSSIDKSSIAEEISTFNSVKNDQESTTISPNIMSSPVIFTVAETILFYKSGEDEETTVGYFTTIKPETEETTPSYLSEKTSQADKIATTEKWLFDFKSAQVSTTMESLDPTHFAETLLTTTETPATSESNFMVDEKNSDVIPTTLGPEMETTTTSGDILLNDQSTTTVESETISILEENPLDSVTPNTLGEKLLFDAISTEESSTMLLTTTETPATSESRFIVDKNNSDVIPTTLVPEMETTTTSSDILLNDQSTTTVESETISILEENTLDSVTPNTLGEKLLFDAISTEEPSTMLLTTTETPATSESRFIVDENNSDVIPTTLVPEMETTTTSGDILLNDQSMTTVESETISILEENTLDSVTPNTLGEKLLFDAISTEESSTMLLTTTETPATSESRFIVDENNSDVIPTTLGPEIETTATSGDILSNDQSTTTVESETISILEENTIDSVTPNTLGGKLLFDAISTEESSTMLLTTTDIPPTSESSFIVDGKISDGDILSNDPSTTTVESETISILEENTLDSATPNTLGEKLLFDAISTEEPSTMLLTTTETPATSELRFIVDKNNSDVIPTTLVPEMETTTTSGDILLNDQTTTTVESETISILEENTLDSVTPNTLGEKLLFDAISTEESSTMLLTTTDIPATSESRFIVDENNSDVIPTTLGPEIETTTTSGDILSNDQSTTTVESETISILEENTIDSVTPNTLGGKLLFDAISTEESSTMLLTTTDIPATSESSFIVDGKISDGDILSNDPSTTTVESETISILEENTLDSATPNTLGEKLLFDAISTEEPSTMLLTTTETPATSESRFIVDKNNSDVIPTTLVPEMDTTTTSGDILSNDQSTTTVESETISILEENTIDSVTPNTLGEKLLFDAISTEESSTMLLTTTDIPATSESRFIVDKNNSDVIPTTLGPEIETTTTSGDILSNDPSTTTVESETISILEENTLDSVTPNTLGEKLLFDAISTEESSTMLLTTTETPATSESSFIVDGKISDGDILSNDPSTTTVESETISILEENTLDSVTPNTLGEKLLFDAISTEESSTMLLTTTEIPATSVSNFIVDRKTSNATKPTTEATSLAETEVASDSGEILRNNLSTTSNDFEITTSNILENRIESVLTSTTPVNDYVVNEDFLKSVSTTENSSFDENADDDKTVSVDTTTVIPETSDYSESSPIVEENPKNLVISMTTSSEGESTEIESTTENSLSSISDAGSNDDFDTT